MRVVVDFSLCESHGQCVLAAPAVFHGFDDESVLQFDERPPEAARAAVEQAVAVCPAAAITVRRDGGE